MTPKMSSRQRMLATFGLQEPDRVPVIDEVFNVEIFEAALGYRPEYITSEETFRCSVGLGLDASYLFYADYPAIEPEGNTGGRWESEWGCVYEKHEGAWAVGMPRDYRVKSRQDLKHFRPPDPNRPGRMDSIKRTADLRADNDLALIGVVRGPFALAAYHFIGMVPTMEAIYDDPKLLSTAFRLIVDYDMEICRQMAACGADIVWITEDVAGTAGPLLNPAHYRELVLPYLRELLDCNRSLGMPTVFHSDGNVMPFLDDLIDAGISALNPIEPAAGMDLGEVKRKYGDRICLIGNVDNKAVLTEGSPQLVEETVRDCIRAAALGGGYVVMSDNSWHAGVSVENARAQVKAARKWGRYPLDWIERE